MTNYEQMYQNSIKYPEEFWLEQAKSLDWYSPPTKACEHTWKSSQDQISHTWFEDGTLNISYNCLDRHVIAGKGDKIAYHWQGEAPEEQRSLTYNELLDEVCRFSNLLLDKGVEKGDRVCLYMPMVIEAIVAMLACTRIGAIHSVVFGGFSPEALADRINDSGCSILISSSVCIRGGKEIPLQKMAEEALVNCPTVKELILADPRSHTFKTLLASYSNKCPAIPMAAEDPSFILYTSGSTGKPKGVVHSTAGYLLHVSMTHKLFFDLNADKDIYWCTADVGWITGHSYVVYGPLCNATSSVISEGIPTYPTPDQYWRLIDQYKVSIFYTAPTAIRSLICHGDAWPEKYKLDSLRILGTVGEPINPEAWKWYREVIGKNRCPIVDTWWQTETGGIMIASIPFLHPQKPGCAGSPFFGVQATIIEKNLSGKGGKLCIKAPWPGIMRSTWGNHQRFIDTYFKEEENLYFTGDGAYQDEQNSFWLLGRIDDVISVSGHRIGSAEVESALVSHPLVAEAAVVPVPHKIKGQGIYVFVTPLLGVQEDLRATLTAHIREKIGPIATPEAIHVTPALPKTRSGKIMRRILRAIAADDPASIGDTSTLADPTIIDQLWSERV